MATARDVTANSATGAMLWPTPATFFSANPPVASVTGIRKSAGAGSTDTAAVAGTDYRKPWHAVPSTSGDTGTLGDEAYDTSYYYICTATNTWKRIALTSF